MCVGLDDRMVTGCHRYRVMTKRVYGWMIGWLLVVIDIE